MTEAQKYGRKIAEAMLELQKQFRANLNTHCEYYEEMASEGYSDETIAAELAENDDFINDNLAYEVMALAKAVLSADWYGLYVAGFVQAAKSYDEYREKEAKQTKDFYHDVNKTIKDFENKMDEWKQGIF